MRKIMFVLVLAAAFFMGSVMATAPANAAEEWPDPSFLANLQWTQTWKGNHDFTTVLVSVWNIEESKLARVTAVTCSGRHIKMKLNRVAHTESFVVKWRKLKDLKAIRVAASIPDPKEKGSSYSSSWWSDLQNPVCS